MFFVDGNLWPFRRVGKWNWISTNGVKEKKKNTATRNVGGTTIPWCSLPDIYGLPINFLFEYEGVSSDLLYCPGEDLLDLARDLGCVTHKLISISPKRTDRFWL